MKISNWLIIAAILPFAACQDPNAQGDETEHGAEASMLKYTLVPFSASQAYPNAYLESMNYIDGHFEFGVSGDSYQLGVQTPDAGAKMCANSAKGQHIHLIVDNEPYSAHYTEDFDYDMPDGTHYVLAFLSRSYHESIKTPQAYILEKVQAENKNFTSSEEVTDPMLFYSRPKGTYTGHAETDKVMLDFYLANLELGSAYKVKAEINGEEHIIDEWKPYYIEGLPLGENTIKLTLIDGSGNPVNTPLNPVTRTFTLAADPAESN